MFFRSRSPLFTWSNYLIATDEEVERETRWAKNRESVLSRWTPEDGVFPKSPVDKDFPSDVYGVGLGCLSKEERTVYESYRKKWPRSACNVSQNPMAMGGSKSLADGSLQTLCKSGGLVVLPAPPYNPLGNTSPRWMLPEELFTSMGFPISFEAQRACCGAVCSFSRGQQAPSVRSPACQRSQVGNSIHVNMIGAIST
eukprot:1071427-Pyramimonas_sp.AAC.1